MLPRPALRLASLLALLAVPRASLAAWPNSTTAPLVLASGAGEQASFSSIPDGSGGLIVAWGDLANPNVNIYVQRYDANGNALWGGSGLLLDNSGVAKGIPAVVTDGAGGAVVSWPEQFEVVGIRAQRVNASGTVLWSVPGLRVATQAADVYGYSTCPDGTGGALFAWEYVYSSTDHDVYVQHMGPTGTQLEGVGGFGVCANTAMQDMVVTVSDGSGGQWVLWRDNRTATSDVYAQRVTSVGGVPFASGGFNCEDLVPGNLQGLTAVPDGFGGAIGACALNPYGDFDAEVFHVYPDGTHSTSVPSVSGGNQTYPVLAADNDGGAFVAWNDDRADIRGDIYGSHVTSTGNVSPGWGASGTPIATGADVYQSQPALTPDGQGGAILAWTEGGPSIKNIVATRFRTDGSRLPGWSSTGNPVMTKPVPNGTAVLSATGAGGAFVVWNSGFGSEVDLLAQRIEQFGEVGTPEPHIHSVRDVPNDQGGEVRVTWDASYMDSGSRTDVAGYQLWRQVPAASAIAALRSGAARMVGPGAGLGGGRVFRTRGPSLATTYWEYTGGVAAQKFAGYSMTAPTTGDSVAASNPRTQFMVEAVGSWYAPGPVAADTWWDSAPDSGYSVDNLPPALPASFIATWTSSYNELHWNANTEPDMANYRLYRGSTSGFTPSPANRIASPVQTWFDDPGAPPSWYKLSAVDIHGNESPFAVASTSGASDVASDLPTELALAITSANPAPGSLALRLDLPHAASVELGVFDAAGRRLAVLRSGAMAAGRWPLAWDGAGAGGARAAPGLYYVRLVADGRTLTRRVVLLQ
jgi:hypothetical protein